MDEQKVREAIEVLKGIEEVRGNLPEDGNEIEEAFLVAIKALEKQLPKKPVPKSTAYGRTRVCPVCGANDYDKYCRWCGQRIKWLE